MKRRLVNSALVLAATLALTTLAFAQSPKVSNWGGQADGPVPKLPPPDANTPFNPRDFSGVWETNHQSTGGYRGMTAESGIPRRTPWAEQIFRSRITGRPTKEKAGLPPALGNDPIMACNPYGFPRLLFYTNPLELFHTPDRILMIFEWQRAPREIWMDGRELPRDPDPRWMGYSVGRWEGDTLVIDTAGFDDRAWLDQYGNVYSTEMHFEERWKRTGRDTLEVVYRLEDPKSYTRPWISTTKVFRREAYELREELCAPMDEGFFNENVRDPAGGIIKK